MSPPRDVLQTDRGRVLLKTGRQLDVCNVIFSAITVSDNKFE